MQGCLSSVVLCLFFGFILTFSARQLLMQAYQISKRITDNVANGGQIQETITTGGWPCPAPYRVPRTPYTIYSVQSLTPAAAFSSFLFRLLSFGFGLGFFSFRPCLVISWAMWSSFSSCCGNQAESAVRRAKSGESLLLVICLGFSTCDYLDWS